MARVPQSVLSPTDCPPPRRPRRGRTSLHLEMLEDRTVPTNLVYWHGGSILQNVIAVPTFWGTSFASQYKSLETQETNFTSYLVNSTYMDMMSEYGTPATSAIEETDQPGGAPVFTSTNHPAHTIGRGSVGDVEVDTDPGAPTTGTTVTDGQIQDNIAGDLFANTLDSLGVPGVSALDESFFDNNYQSLYPDVLFVVYLPPGVNVQDANGQTLYQFQNGSEERGYHGTFGLDQQGNVDRFSNGSDALGSNDVFVHYAVVPYPTGGVSTTNFDQVTITASHEIMEAVTDPLQETDNSGNITQAGFIIDNPTAFDSHLGSGDNEVGDLVEFQPPNLSVSELGGYAVQNMFSNVVYNANHASHGIKAPAGSTSYGGFALADGDDNPQHTSAPVLGSTSTSVTTLPNGHTLTISTTTLANGTVTGTFSAQLDPSGLGTTEADVKPVDGINVYSFNETITPQGMLTGNFTITAEGKALGYTVPDAPSLVPSTALALTAVSPNNTATSWTFSGQLASFTDAAGASDAASINWGDGSLTAGTIVADANVPGQFDVKGTHTYAAGSTGTNRSVYVIIHKSDGSQVVADAQIINGVADLVATALPADEVQGSSAVVALDVFSDLGGLHSASWYTATVNWGDGTVTSGSVVASGSQFVVLGNHPYQQPGHYHVTVTVQDIDSSKDTFPSTVTVRATQPSAIGGFDPTTATWYLHNGVGGGAADAGSFQYGAPGWIPVTGDWTGSGHEGIGVYNPATATWYLRNSVTPGPADEVIQFGAPGWLPVVGDWSGGGHTGIGVVNPSTDTWYLRNEDSPGAADAGTFQFGAPGWLPVAGDWNATGRAGIGVYNPSTATWYLRGEASGGPIDVGTVQYGAPGWTPIVGDWGGHGHTGLGILNPAGGAWYLRNEVTAGPPDAGVFGYGSPGWLPVAGGWIGSARNGIGAVNPATATWYLRNQASAGGVTVGAFQFGSAGWIPLVGDWNGTGHDGIGEYDPSTATWYLRNEDNGGPADAGVFQFGAPGWIPVVGDWTGAGHTGIGVFDPRTATWYLRVEASGGPADAGVFQYGAANWIPVTGDWTGAGYTGIGVFDPGTATWYLRTLANPGPANAVFQYGAPGWLPVVGDWSGDGFDGIGVYYPGSGAWYLRSTPSAGPQTMAFGYGSPGWKPVVGEF